MRWPWQKKKQRAMAASLKCATYGHQPVVLWRHLNEANSKVRVVLKCSRCELVYEEHFRL